MIGEILELAAAGFAFGSINAVQSRIANTDSNGRAGSSYPVALLFSSVLMVSFVYAVAMRLIASTTGVETLACYAIARALGCCSGVYVSNTWLYKRFHRNDAHA